MIKRSSSVWDNGLFFGGCVVDAALAEKSALINTASSRKKTDRTM